MQATLNRWLSSPAAKPLAFAAALSPAVWLVVAAAMDWLGANPAEALERSRVGLESELQGGRIDRRDAPQHRARRRARLPGRGPLALAAFHRAGHLGPIDRPRQLDRRPVQLEPKQDLLAVEAAGHRDDAHPVGVPLPGDLRAVLLQVERPAKAAVWSLEGELPFTGRLRRFGRIRRVVTRRAGQECKEKEILHS